MKLRRFLLLAAIGFIAGLVATAPARLVSIFLPGNISLDGLSGQARSAWERVILGLVALFVIPGLLGVFFLGE